MIPFFWKKIDMSQFSLDVFWIIENLLLLVEQLFNRREQILMNYFRNFKREKMNHKINF